jgi:type IV pilus biogenesis protein PilP
MRSLWIVSGLIASTAIGAEPAARIDPPARVALTAAAASVSSVQLRNSASGATPGVLEQASESPSVPPAMAAVPAPRAGSDATLTFDHLQGERSRLEAEKQLLTLQVDIATLQRKLAELKTTPKSLGATAGPPVIPVEPPPTVLTRRGFDGHFTAVLRMSTGGKLVVHPGDTLPNGKVDAVDSQSVLVTWYGRRLRLVDAEAEEGNGPGAIHSLDLTLPVAPPAVATH